MTILFSIFVFGEKTTALQWSGLLLVTQLEAFFLPQEPTIEASKHATRQWPHFGTLLSDEALAGMLIYAPCQQGWNT